MKYVFISVLFIFSIGCTDQKSVLVERQMELKKQIDSMNLEYTFVRDSMEKMITDPSRQLPLESNPEWKRLDISKTHWQLQKSFLQETYDSLQWEIKKF